MITGVERYIQKTINNYRQRKRGTYFYNQYEYLHKKKECSEKCSKVEIEKFKNIAKTQRKDSKQKNERKKRENDYEKFRNKENERNNGENGRWTYQ